MKLAWNPRFLTYVPPVVGCIERYQLGRQCNEYSRAGPSIEKSRDIGVALPGDFPVPWLAKIVSVSKCNFAVQEIRYHSYFGAL